ncbi:MAG: 16S rRNA (adenine(1518)-N(6)/adenine(1519)-N(6))-dimethyltransferase RsmA [Burkholderiaceae bacterium]
MSLHVARKRFGQHFLVDRDVITAIVRSIAPRPDDAMVEIGPGLGALTAPLIEAREAVGGNVTPLRLVELDRDLAARLRKRFDAKRMIIHEADALDFDFASLAPAAASLRIVGNLPYNISTPLLFHLLAIADRVVDQHFMLQKEVVARMVAEPGTSDFGRLSVMLQVRYDMASLFDVPPTAFDPPPKVTSAIVRMTPLAPSALKIVDQARFARIVMAAFGQRRKMLRNSLAAYAEAMEALAVSPTARAEEIAPEMWIALSNHGAPP